MEVETLFGVLLLFAAELEGVVTKLFSSVDEVVPDDDTELDDVDTGRIEELPVDDMDDDDGGDGDEDAEGDGAEGDDAEGDDADGDDGGVDEDVGDGDGDEDETGELDSTREVVLLGAGEEALGCSMMAPFDI